MCCLFAEVLTSWGIYRFRDRIDVVVHERLSAKDRLAVVNGIRKFPTVIIGGTLRMEDPLDANAIRA